MKKRFYIIIPVVVILVSFLITYFYFNNRDENTNLTIAERRWIENNNSEKIDIEIFNDYPVYGLSGTGVFFDLINDFETDTNLEFNRIPFTEEAEGESYQFRVLKNEQVLSQDDLLIAEDNYVAISKRDIIINNLSSFDDKNVGVLKDDHAELTYYLRSVNDLQVTPLLTISDLTSALNQDTVDYIVIPKIAYLNIVLSSDEYYINYNFNEFVQRIVLTLSADNPEVNNIISKYYTGWKKQHFVASYNKQYFNYYVLLREVNDKEKADLVSKTYVYGYVKNDPYEVLIDGDLEGVAAEYIRRLSRLTTIEFDFREYKSIAALKKAIEEKEVDLYFNYINTKNDNYVETVSMFDEKFVVLSQPEKLFTVNSFESLKGSTVNMISNNALFEYVKDNSRANVKEYNNINSLAKSNGLKLVDYEVYVNHQNKEFKDEVVIYQDSFTSEYTYAINKEDQVFYNLLNHLMRSNSYNSYRILALNNLELSIFERSNFSEFYVIVLGIISFPLVVTLSIYLILKNKNKKRDFVEEDRRKYTDFLTSLKNRSYLNANIDKWDESNVFPRAIIIIDLNKIKYVNENYGHEAGDNLIVKAAGVLINNQLEKSEIIRTDGNEFLIYLVGYSKQQVTNYTKKLKKELKALPYGFGAELGFSMILDDIKLIDDAINEATVEMKATKEN